jgi:hypothetical protein
MAGPMRALKRLLVWIFVLPPSPLTGREPPKADAAVFASTIRPLLVAHCFRCHSAEAKKPKGDSRLDKLSTDLADDATQERWLAILKRA